MLLAIIIILLILLIIYLLVVPIIMVIDTDNGIYSLRVKGLFSAFLLRDEKEILRLRLNLLLYDFNVYPLKYINRKKAKRKPKTKEVSKQKNYTKNLKAGFRILRSFEVRRFNIDLDTGDCITNAKLYPLCSFVNFYLVDGFNINFIGRNSMLLEVENRPIRIIRSYFNV